MLMEDVLFYVISILTAMTSKNLGISASPKLFMPFLVTCYIETLEIIPDNLYCVGGDVKPCSINRS